jgi:hypothetical protein
MEPILRWLSARQLGIEIPSSVRPASGSSDTFGIPHPSRNPTAHFDRTAFLAAFGEIVQPSDPPEDQEGLDAYEQSLRSMIAAGQQTHAAGDAGHGDDGADQGCSEHWSDETDDAAFAASCQDSPLSSQHLQEIRDFLHDDLGIEPTDDQIRAVIPPGTETHAVICTYGVESDTATRDEVADRFCEHLVGRRHPLGLDGFSDKQLDAFADSVIAAARKAGIPVSDDGELRS